VFDSASVDLRCRHKNRSVEFAGGAHWVADLDEDGDVAALEAIGRSIEERGTRPNQRSWSAAGRTPAEKTIRRRLGSLAAAIKAVARNDPW
jgi:hypothetical protein